MGLVAQHQLSTFTSPINGTSPIDANTVRGNDNSIKTTYNTHDADTTIHLQNSAVASRPAASTAGQMWLTTDTGAVYVYYDTGSAWVEVNYLRSTGGTVSGATTFSAVVTFSAQPILSTLTASRAVFTDSSKGLVSNAITGTGNVVMSASPTLTGTITAENADFSGTVTMTTYTGQSTIVTVGALNAGSITNGFGSIDIGTDQITAGAARFSKIYAPSASYALTDGATIALDWVNGNVQKVTLGGNRTFTFANPVDGMRCLIYLTQDGTGSRTITWPTIRWTGGSAPTLTTTAAKTDIISITYMGTDYFGASVANC